MKYGGSVKKMEKGGVLDKVRSAAEQSLARKSKDYKITEVGGKARKQEDFPNLSAKEMKKRQEMLARAKEIAQGMEKGGPATPTVLPKPKPKATATSTNRKTGATRGAGDDKEYMRKAAAANMEGGGEVRGMGRAYQGKPRACKVR